MPEYLMGIDIGGTETKTALFDTEGREYVCANRRLPMKTPHPGFTERDPKAVWDATVETIREVLLTANVEPRLIRAVGLTGYGNGVCLVDASGEPTRDCIVSTDCRADDICRRFRSNGVERSLFPRTLQTLWSAQPAALLPWLVENEPHVMEKTRYALGIKDYIRFRLTGEFIIEETEASSGGLYDVYQKRFDPALFEALGIPELSSIMPPCVASDSVSGTVTREAEEVADLVNGTPVAGGYFDIDAGAFASGVLEAQR